jgi:hypothetical protein
LPQSGNEAVQLNPAGGGVQVDAVGQTQSPSALHTVPGALTQPLMPFGHASGCGGGVQVVWVGQAHWPLMQVVPG